MEDRVVACTERTIVSRITIEDAPFMVSLVNSPGWLRFIGDHHVANLADAERFLEDGFLKSAQENGFGYYLVRTVQGSPIGICGFLKKTYLQYPDFGFAFMPEFIGKGFAFEACKAVMLQAVTYYQFTVLEAVLTVDNGRSKRLLEKLGFRMHGRLRLDDYDSEMLQYRWVKSIGSADRP